MQEVCLLTELSMCSRRQFSGRVKSMVRGGRTQPSTLIFSRLVSFSGQKGTADCTRKNKKKRKYVENRGKFTAPNDNRNTKRGNFSTDLLWSSLGPVFLALFTDKHTLLGPVDQHVERHEGDNAGQTEAAGVDLHAHLRPSTQVMTVEAVFHQTYRSSPTPAPGVLKAHQVVFVAAFALHISVAADRVQGEIVRELAV